MSYCTDWDECDCDCHRCEGVMHCMPCCYPCPKCGRNISAGVHGLHVDACDGDLDPNMMPLLNIDLNDTKITEK